jgi:hypothetical protein
MEFEECNKNKTRKRKQKIFFWCMLAESQRAPSWSPVPALSSIADSSSPTQRPANSPRGSKRMRTLGIGNGYDDKKHKQTPEKTSPLTMLLPLCPLFFHRVCF